MLDSIIRWVELPARILLPLGIAGFLALQVESIGNAFGLAPLIEEHKSLFGLATYGFLVLGISHAFLSDHGLANRLLSYVGDKIRLSKIVDSVDDLSDEERFVIQYCLFRKNSTFYAGLTYSPCKSLQDKGFLTIQPGYINQLAAPWQIRSPVWKVLKHNFSDADYKTLAERKPFTDRVDHHDRWLHENIHPIGYRNPF